MTESHGLTEFLKERDRILMAAWMLPNEGPLTEAQRTQAMANFAAYLRRHGLTFADVGHQVGKPKATTIRDLVLGKFREHGETDTHVRILNNWIEQHARQAAVAVKGRFVSTKVALDIQTVARLAQEQGVMALAVGPTGIGKSRCAEALAETYSGAILLTVMARRRTADGVLSHLAEKLKLYRQAAVSEDMRDLPRHERVLHRLKNSNRLVIVDEAHKLHPGGLEFLRELHDATGIPIVLLATKDLQKRIENDADPDHGQLYSRIPIIVDLVPAARVSRGGDRRQRVSPPEALFRVEDIRRLYQTTPIRLAEDSVRYLLEVANDLGRGSLRKCAHLVAMAARRARKRCALDDRDVVTITAEDLYAAETMLKRDPTELECVDARRRQSVAAG